MFNAPTGLSIWCSEALTLALVLFMAWRHDTKTHAYLFWCLGFALSAIGFALVAARGFIPNVLSIEIANTIALLGQSAWVAGFLALDKRKLEWWALLPPAVWLLGVFLPWINESFANRVALYNLASTAGAAALSLSVVPVNAHREKTRLMLSTIFLIQAVVCFGTALAIASMRPSDSQAVDFGGVAALATAFLLTLAFALTFRLVMERSERQLRALAVTDPLTGVFNRRGLFDYFSRVRDHARAKSGLVAMLLFDLDHFKQLNDAHGHQAGDGVLVQFARVARQFIPTGFGRMGGEEFAAFVYVRDQFEAEAIAESVRMEFCRLPVTAGTAFLSPTVSVGVAMASAAEADCDKLISAADRALYAAKANGRNCCIVFGEADTAAPPPVSPDPNGGELVATLDDQIHALKRIGSLSRL